MAKIQIDQHTLERAKERGANEQEIFDVINNGFSVPAKLGANVGQKSTPLIKKD